jgi:hypothetical protein
MHVIGLSIDDLPGEKIGDQAIAPGHAAGHGTRVAVAHRERRQYQRSGPAFGADLQVDDLVACQAVFAERREKVLYFISIELKVTLADVDEPRSRTPSGERQSRVGTAGDQEPQVRRKTLDD